MVVVAGFVIAVVATLAKWRRQAMEMLSTRACKTCTIRARQAEHANDKVNEYSNPTTFMPSRSLTRWCHGDAERANIDVIMEVCDSNDAESLESAQECEYASSNAAM